MWQPSDDIAPGADGGDGGGGLSPSEMLKQGMLFVLMAWSVGWLIWD
jgi:hypothetical protein